MTTLSGIGIVAPPDHHDLMCTIADFLAHNGVEVQPDVALAETCVVLVTSKLLEVWAQRPGLADKRLVPLAMERGPRYPVPEAVAAINWTFWEPDNPEASLATLLVAVSTRQGEWRTLRGLRVEANAWHEADRSPTLLNSELPRALEYKDVLESLRQAIDKREDFDKLEEFVTASIVVATTKARKQRRRWLTVVAALVVVGVITAVLIPVVQNAGRTNRNAIVTSGEDTLAREYPEWSALLSGAQLLNGTEEQRQLARLTLRRSLAAEWSLGSIDLGPGRSLEASTPLSGLRSAVALSYSTQEGRSSLVGTEVKTGRLTWRVQLPGEYLYFDTPADESVVVVGGPAGIGVFDLRDHSFRKAAFGSEPWWVAALDAHRAVVVDRELRAHVVDLDPGGGSRATGDYDDRVLDVQATEDGGVRALIRRRPGEYAVVDATTGGVLATGAVPEPLATAGGVAADEVAAFVVGADHQVWRLAPNEQATPTGVAVSDRTTLIRSGHAGRIVVGGEAQRPRVVQLPSGVELGVVCRETPLIKDIRVTHDGAAVSCVGPRQNSLWSLPSGPTPVVSDYADDGHLLDLLRERMHGCWKETQIENLDADTRASLGVHLCGPVPAPSGR
ncbi:PQQ-like beta-propeller repeat protein [Saccharothrix sp. S26]|uniref:PQQ-like beta-propeller repeat protein n=1 Tax=Saccharothrix sp. S26 TaxID=2907215 RepID=UPI001F15CC09|nr:PQQ-like beta-propeller repeat protein [Saccharothrix sp. S26]MCE7000409.1 PQQ-like beta-propeller repeat protein [Saccharothrix sp. S26]